MNAIEDNKNKIRTIFETYLSDRPGINNLWEWLEKSDYFTAPASTIHHGSYEGGLAEHSLNVCNILGEIYNTLLPNQTPDDSQILVALMHDICKVHFYKKEFRNRKNEETGQWEKVEVYTYDDKLPLGHGEKSVIILQNFIHLSKEEMFAIRWHMGGFDNASRGGERAMSLAYEQCPLAVALHLADMAATYFYDGKGK